MRLSDLSLEEIEFILKCRELPLELQEEIDNKIMEMAKKYSDKNKK